MVSIPRLLFLALFVAVASAQQYCTFNSSVTKAGLYDQNGLCNCYSGFYSSEPNYLNCFNKASDSCFWNPAPQQLSTGYVPILDDLASGVFGGKIVMVVRSPLVIDRLSTTAAWQNGAEDYSYPGSYWSKTVENCTDTFTFSLPLTNAYDAGFEPSEDDTYYYLNGVVVFTYYDSIGEMRGQPLTRTTQSVLRIEIRFPKRITVTSAVSVYSGYDLLAVITFQAYDPVTNTGIFEYTTSLPYPFRVDNVIGLTFPSPIDGSSGPIQDLNCGTSFNSTCLQKFRLTTNPNGACRLSGDYNITVAIGCRGAASCAPGSGVIASQITSEDICSVVRIDIDLTGSMKVYSDDTFSSPAASFLPGQSAVFLTNVASSKAVIASSSISDVFYTMPDGSSNSLYSGGASSALAGSNGFSIVPINETASYFTISISVGTSASDLFNPRALDPSAFPPITAPSTVPFATAPIADAAPFDGTVPLPDAPPVPGFFPPVPDTPIGAVPTPNPFPLDPILDCIEQVNSSSYIAYFSYQNPFGDFSTYPIGATNGFTGNGLTLADVGQPTTFPEVRSLPYPVGAFQYQWNGASPVSWTLNGVERVADPGFLPNRCPTTLMFYIGFAFGDIYPLDVFEERIIVDKLSIAMGMRSNLNLVLISSNVYYNPTGGGNLVTLGFKIDPFVDSPDISAKEAMLNLIAARSNATLMRSIVDPYNADPARLFEVLMMLPVPNQMSSYPYFTPSFAKRAVDSENTIFVHEKPQRREIVQSVKREVAQDVSGNVQFSAVIEVEWIGFAGNKKKFAFDLKQAKLPSGSQDKKFSAYIGIGQAAQNEPNSFSTNVPDPTSTASAVYLSISALIIMIVNLLL